MEDWVKILQSKEQFYGSFQHFIVPHGIQHVKLCTFPKFLACIIKCTICPFFEEKQPSLWNPIFATNFC